MAEQIIRDIGEIEKGLTELKKQADDFVSESGYQDGTDNKTFQSVNGASPVSTSQSVEEVAALDTFAYKSICSWGKTTENLIAFIDNDMMNILYADKGE